MENTQERTKEVWSTSCVKSVRIDNTEDTAGNIKDGLKLMEQILLCPGSNLSYEPNVKGGAYPFQLVSTWTT